ncbi:MAG: helix-turn-helix domain-containing protein [Bacteroidales bacterium]|nr:helix-turn-helix domain-containing protein [Bacteroidales bacterium]
MKERIIEFLKTNNLTSTKFADSIGVQRSSVSHILSGRNKPSYDFIEKMLLAYPSIDAQWLITGKGIMVSNQPTLFEQEKIKKETGILTQRESNNQKKQIPQDKIIDSTEDSNNSSYLGNIMSESQKSIERVMIFYADGTFKEYKSK